MLGNEKKKAEQFFIIGECKKEESSDYTFFDFMSDKHICLEQRAQVVLFQRKPV